MRRGQEAPLVLPPHVRLVVPVLAAAGGQGRSTVSGMLGVELPGPAAVLDTAPRGVSPWTTWLDRPGAGMESVPPDRPLSARQAAEALSGYGPPEAEATVLTDLRGWSAAPLAMPGQPAAWRQLARIGDWPAVVVDTGYAALTDLDESRFTEEPSRTAGWTADAGAVSVPVLCVDGTARGVEMAQAVVDLAEAGGLPASRVVLAVIGRAGNEPRAAAAGLTMLAHRVGDVVRLPRDPAVQAFGLRNYTRLENRTRQAARHLARTVVGLATAASPPPAAEAVPQSSLLTSEERHEQSADLHVAGG